MAVENQKKRFKNVRSLPELRGRLTAPLLFPVQSQITGEPLSYASLAQLRDFLGIGPTPDNPQTWVIGELGGTGHLHEAKFPVLDSELHPYLNGDRLHRVTELSSNTHFMGSGSAFATWRDVSALDVIEWDYIADLSDVLGLWTDTFTSAGSYFALTFAPIEDWAIVKKDTTPLTEGTDYTIDGGNITLVVALTTETLTVRYLPIRTPRPRVVETLGTGTSHSTSDRPFNQAQVACDLNGDRMERGGSGQMGYTVDDQFGNITTVRSISALDDFKAIYTLY